MSKGTIIEISLDKLIKFKVSIEGFLVLYCIYLSKQDILGEYLAKAGTVPLKLINSLQDKGYLLVPQIGEINTKTIKLTDKFKINFIEDVVGLDFDQCLAELRLTYPKKIKTETGGTRQLQPDPKLIRELYKKTLVKRGIIDLELHKNVLKSIKYEINERTKSNNLYFMVMLSRYLRHNYYEANFEDMKNWKESDPIQKTNIDSI